MSKYPPVPPANRSPKGAPQGSDSATEVPARNRRKPGEPPNNLREQGDAGNIKQNTTNDGYQQDR